jgi:hypothetical protein
MRPSLLHPLGEARHSRRHRRGRGAAAVEPARESAPVEPVREPAPATGDLAVARAREAGGPIDRASYSCQCGFVFCAPVSTTVACPHCGVAQAW